jgi:hypothetical protein
MTDLRPAPTATITTRLTRTLQLGHTSDDVADRLRALNIKGRRHMPHQCAIANLLLRQDQVVAVEVLEAVAEVFLAGCTEPVEIPVPEPTSEFIVDFDRGVHLDLVDHTEVTA